MKKINIAVLSGACLLALATVANATTTTTASIGGAAAGSIRDNLDSLVLGTAPQVSSTGILVSFTPDGGVVNGGLSGIYAAPFLSGSNGAGFGPGGTNQAGGPDSTNYLTAGGQAGSSATLQFSQNLKSVGLLWGSIDGYNTLFLKENGVTVGTVFGADALAASSAVAGSQSADGTAYVLISSDVSFNEVVTESSQHAFEFDDISYSAVPEPLTLSLFGAGLAGAAALRRRKKADVV